jgi:hypothetical protein
MIPKEERGLELMTGTIPFPPMGMRFLVRHVSCAVVMRVTFQVLLISHAIFLIWMDWTKLPLIPILQPSGSLLI